MFFKIKDLSSWAPNVAKVFIPISPCSHIWNIHIVAELMTIKASILNYFGHIDKITSYYTIVQTNLVRKLANIYLLFFETWQLSHFWREFATKYYFKKLNLPFGKILLQKKPLDVAFSSTFHGALSFYDLDMYTLWLWHLSNYTIL